MPTVHSAASAKAPKVTAVRTKSPESRSCRAPRSSGPAFTGAAYARGLALALPEKAAMARPTGVERANAMNIPIAIARANL